MILLSLEVFKAPLEMIIAIVASSSYPLTSGPEVDMSMMKVWRVLVMGWAGAVLTSLSTLGSSPPWPVSWVCWRESWCRQEECPLVEQTVAVTLFLAPPDHCWFHFRFLCTLDPEQETCGSRWERMVPLKLILISCRGLAPDQACCVCWSWRESWEQCGHDSDEVWNNFQNKCWWNNLSYFALKSGLKIRFIAMLLRKVSIEL